MDDIMDPTLASKIECFMSRKNSKYHLFDEARPRWNGYEYTRRKKWPARHVGQRSVSEEDFIWD